MTTTIITKDSPQVQDLLHRIQQTVPDLTGSVGNLWVERVDGKVEVSITYDQDGPTETTHQHRPGRYSLVAVFSPCQGCDGWEIHDYVDSKWWYLPATQADAAIIQTV